MESLTLEFELKSEREWLAGEEEKGELVFKFSEEGDCEFTIKDSLGMLNSLKKRLNVVKLGDKISVKLTASGQKKLEATV